MKALFICTFTILVGVSFGMMTGGWSEVKDLNSPEIQQYAKLATEKLVEEIDSRFHLKLMNVTKAHQQVVAGMNYKIHMSIAPSECLKSDNYTKEEIEACPLQPCDNPLLCSAKVWAQVWKKENPYKVTEASCEPGDSFC